MEFFTMSVLIFTSCPTKNAGSMYAPLDLSISPLPKRKIMSLFQSQYISSLSHSKIPCSLWTILHHILYLNRIKNCKSLASVCNYVMFTLSITANNATIMAVHLGQVSWQASVSHSPPLVCSCRSPLSLAERICRNLYHHENILNFFLLVSKEAYSHCAVWKVCSSILQLYHLPSFVRLWILEIFCLLTQCTFCWEIHTCHH